MSVSPRRGPLCCRRRFHNRVCAAALTVIVACTLTSWDGLRLHAARVAGQSFVNSVNTHSGAVTARSRCRRNSFGISTKLDFEATATGDLVEQFAGPVAEVAPLALAVAGVYAAGSAVKANLDGPPELELSPGSLQGRTILITGGGAGLGFETAIRTAQAGATVVVTARSAAKAEATQSALRAASGSADVYALTMDLADLASVRKFVDTFRAQPYGNKLDVLVNNAGVMAVPARVETQDGFEKQMGVNHLGHFALTGLLLPLLRQNPTGARVISVSSSANRFADTSAMWAGLETTMSEQADYSPWPMYSLSKLANVVFASELDRRFKSSGVRATAVSLHPGVCPTELSRYVVSGEDKSMEDVYSDFPAPVQGMMQMLKGALRPVSRGANTHVFLASGADGGYGCSGGQYFEDMAPAEAHPEAQDAALGVHLWEESERLTGVKFDFGASQSDGTS